MRQLKSMFFSFLSLFGLVACGDPEYPDRNNPWGAWGFLRNLRREHAHANRDASGGGSGSGGGEAWFPTSGWGVLLVLAGIYCSVRGIRSLFKGEGGWLWLGAGLAICSLTLGPTDLHLHFLPHAHWTWAVLPALAWAIMKFFPLFRLGTLDERGMGWVYVGYLVLTVFLRGLFGYMTPFSAFWALLTVAWLWGGSEQVLKRWAGRPWMLWILLSLGWYVLAVTA